jgi:hypothetical protein
MSRIILGALTALLLHVTPTVELVKRVDAVRQMFPAADAWFEREVHLSDPDAHKLHQALDWSPDDGVLRFYTGKHAGAAVGALVFVRVDTPHGPLEVAVGFNTDGTVASVVVTKATVETKPWVLTAVRAGLCEHYKGIRPGAAPKAAEQIRGVAGELPTYMGAQIDKGVQRALVAYADFYK